MRAAWMLGGWAVALISTANARAEPKTYPITLPEVMVRSGPSPEFYPTSKLHQGDKVRVLLPDEATGWLAIEPPPASFSWIDMRLVESSGAHAAVVSAAEAPILVGSRLLNAKPTVTRIRVAKGTQLRVIGRAEEAPDGRWLPILPAPAEVRYIPADAIRSSPAMQPVAATTPEPRKLSPLPAGFDSPRPVAPDPASVPVSSASVSPAPPAPSGATNGLWLQAEEAEHAGNVVRARELFEQLAQQVKATDHDLWIRCLNRLQALQDHRSPVVAGSGDPATTGGTGFQAAANFNNGPASGRLPVVAWSGDHATTGVPTPSGSPASLRASPAPSAYCYQQDTGYTVKLSPPVVSTPSPPAPSGQCSELGRLRRTPLSEDGKPLFCLQPLDASRRHLYVTASANVNLEAYLERTVCLYGPVVYRGDLRTNYMTVVQVSPAR